MKKLDKKQIPQFIALCVITAGLAGYVVMRLVAPGPVSAGTRVAAAPTPASAPAASPAPGTPAAAGAAKPSDSKLGDAKLPGAADTGDAPPPTPAMHDPFAVGYVDPATKSAAANLPVGTPALPKLPAAGKQTASAPGMGAIPISFPGAPALPAGLSSFPARPGGAMPGLPSVPSAPALPAAPSAPLWTVTGVLQGATGKVAILRSGEARRIVRSGDFVDSTYRVTGVTRTSVLLRHGATTYQLPLGGANAAPVKPGSVPAAPQSVSMPQSVPMPQQAAISDGAIIPVYHMADPKSALAHLHRPLPALDLASGSLSLPSPAKSASPKSTSPAKVASAISLGLRLFDSGVLARSRKSR